MYFASQKELVEYLVREGYLKTARIIRAFKAIDRKYFVPPELKSQAYFNVPVPIGFGQTISQPLTVAFMLELLQPRFGDKILDIGSGSGWTTALLAYITYRGYKNLKKTRQDKEAKIWAIERIPQICEWGRGNAEKYFSVNKKCFSLENKKICKKKFNQGKKIIFFCGDGSCLPQSFASFDKILVSASLFMEKRDILENIPQSWKKALKAEGIIVFPAAGSLWKVNKKDKRWQIEEYPGFSFVPLVQSKN